MYYPRRLLRLRHGVRLENLESTPHLSLSLFERQTWNTRQRVMRQNKSFVCSTASIQNSQVVFLTYTYFQHSLY